MLSTLSTKVLSILVSCCCSATKLCPTLYNSMNCSMPGFPVLHYLPEFAQTHVHWVSDAIQPSCPLLPPSSPALNLLEHCCCLLFSRFGTSGLQHTRLAWPSPSPRVCSNSCPLSQWCHPTISSSAAPFSFRPQSFPASGSFPMNQLFTSGDQSTRAFASASVPPINIQD